MTALESGSSVYLRHSTKADNHELQEFAQSSRDFHRPWIYLPNEPDEVARYFDSRRRADHETLLVCRFEDDAIVGIYNVGQIFRGDFQNAYLGYYARAGYQGSGYMTEGLQLVLRYVFTKLKLHRVEANIQPGNDRSVALVDRAGFRREGFSSRYLKVGGRWCDHERWAITVEDWQT